MRYEAKIIRKPSRMRKVLLFLLCSALVCFVYSAEVADAFKGSIDYIVKVTSKNNENPTWTYTCKDSRCLREELGKNDNTQKISLETCNMICGPLPLWPKPMSIRAVNRNVASFTKNEMRLQLNVPNEIRNDLNQSYAIFMNNVPGSYDPLVDTELRVFIQINISSSERILKLTSDESYYLRVLKANNGIRIYLQAATYFGSRHGLETLSQLIWFDNGTQKLNIVHDVQITDKPKFTYRGLMVDTARNYFYVDQLRKVLDGMAATKLNVFHLHLTDASSFPIVLPRNKLFAKYGAYSSEMVYTAEDIKDLIEYARIRGIRVILEIDAPSHMNQDLNKAKKDLVICGEEARMNGHLNPSKSETFQVLQDIYKDLLDLGTSNEIFHIGGDEVNLTCWDQFAPTIAPSTTKNVEVEEYPSYYTENDCPDTMSVWINFTNKMFDMLKIANKQSLPQYTIIWSSDLTDKYLSSLKYKDNIVVQYWFGSIYPILSNGNKVILSTVGQWYLDCGYGSWNTNRDVGVCDPYTTWHTFYKYRPWAYEFPNFREQILGGEACLWSEMVGVDTLEIRIWPRTAAFAERMWSDPDIYDRADVYKRLDIHRERLKRRGIQSEAIWPMWCSQNPGRC